jgi:hypothetical protein
MALRPGRGLAEYTCVFGLGTDAKKMEARSKQPVVYSFAAERPMENRFRRSP